MPTEAPLHQTAPSQTSSSVEQSMLAVPTTQPPVDSSPLPQQLQQYPVPGAMASSSTSSPMPLSQPPVFPPGVKVPQNSDDSTNAAQLASHQQSHRLASPVSAQPQQTGFGSQLHQQAPVRPGLSNAPAAFPGSLSDLVASFETVKQKG